MEEDGESNSQEDGESKSAGNAETQTEEDSEELTHRAESDLKLLRKVVKLWERIKYGTQTMKDAETEELDVAKRCQCKQIFM